MSGDLASILMVPVASQELMSQAGRGMAAKACCYKPSLFIHCQVCTGFNYILACCCASTRIVCLPRRVYFTLQRTMKAIFRQPGDCAKFTSPAVFRQCETTFDRFAGESQSRGKRLKAVRKPALIKRKREVPTQHACTCEDAAACCFRR